MVADARAATSDEFRGESPAHGDAAAGDAEFYDAGLRGPKPKRPERSDRVPEPALGCADILDDAGGRVLGRQ